MTDCAQCKSPTTASRNSNFSHPSLNAGGALDVIVVVQPDGSLRSTPWHVIFDSLGPWGSGRVRVHINGTHLDFAPHLRVSAAQEPAMFAGTADYGERGEAATTATMPPPHVLNHLAQSGLLQEGRNEVRFSVGGDPHALCVRAFLYLWRHDSPAVVFDIDGTVSLHDLAGQAAMLVDGSPTHKGVCELLCRLHARGYMVMYLTSRPLLGVSGIERTRRFLFEVAVDAPSGYRMPPAAVLTTTHNASLQALAAELSGQSKAFKSKALQVVRDAYLPPDVQPPEPAAAATTAGTANAAAAATDGAAGGAGCGGVGSSSSPPVLRCGLYAGFGNREKDALAYLSAGVPPERVFLIDPSSRIEGRAAVLNRTAGAPAAAAGAQPPAPRHAQQLAQRPTWDAYTGLMGSLDELFPLRCAEAAMEAAIHKFSPTGRGSSADAPGAEIVLA